jgi:hypothetical protein
MKQSDSLELVAPGLLLRPGPFGRLLRLVLGSACLYGLYQLLVYREAVIATPLSTLPNLVVLIVVAFWIVNYVVNIGFGKSWGRWPSYVSAIVILASATLGWLIDGTPDNPILGACIWLWLMYFYAHLGLSFVLAALIATPGCEMRSIPQLLGRLSDKKVQEHHCPASLITRIDLWESTIRRQAK